MTVVVPRGLLLAIRAEFRAWTGHWADGFTAAGRPLTEHDRRMAGGGCLACALLTELDAALYPRAEVPAGRQP